ncbi:TetR/AcrR family transcriptional regulator [Paenibacillus zeisoli]|uniref:TetR/AcrR family transcriptional regulator n=1 Tax=Paenibacillus zeisoli TaxID=2496267 RepID=A0A433X4L4_9BACL|nr:TetR-like C-terminal domain-containing protein [Paenibacillus zeisoli]RUT28992.1 TetR/AcrR family transcriptional regulator [Paenibacillus zeisoli]
MPRAGLDAAAVTQAAAEIADRHGLEAVTLASVAQKLGIRSPSLYNHIDGLPGLRNRLAAYSLKLLHSKLEAAAADMIGDGALLAYSRAYVDFAHQHPGLYESTLRAPDSQDYELQKAGHAMVELIVELLNGRGLNADEQTHAVRGLRSILHGFCSLEQKGGFGLPTSLEDSLQFILHAYLQGLPSKTD